MGKYNGPTPKRHKIWSNDEGMVNAILAEAGYMSRSEQKACKGQPTVRRYIDKNGKPRRTGVASALKSSQTLDCSKVYSLFYRGLL